MNEEKMKSKDLNEQVEEFLKKGGSIEQVPMGTSGDNMISLSKKKQLYGLSKRRPGFDKERLILTPKD